MIANFMFPGRGTVSLPVGTGSPGYFFHFFHDKLSFVVSWTSVGIVLVRIGASIQSLNAVWGPRARIVPSDKKFLYYR